MTSSIYLNSMGVLCSLGAGRTQVEQQLFGPASEQTFLSRSDYYSGERNLPLGLVKSELPPVTIAGEESRNNQFLTLALQPLMADIDALKVRFGPDRIGVVVGTSTSGIAEGEVALKKYSQETGFADGYRYRTQEISAPSRFLAKYLGITGPTWTVSTACTSGGKALASAARLLQLGVVDAVIAGGCDTLCRMTVEGFSSLSVTTGKQCNPFSLNRDGINIGEGAGLFVMSREAGPVRLAGYGETSDAHHISAPHPEGRGAESAMRAALAMADLPPEQIDYINLHGTATAQNDKMESLAVNRVFGDQVSCSSTKPLTGHTLGAAGAIEAAFCWLALQRKDGRLPPHVWDGKSDPGLPAMKGLGQEFAGNGVKAAMSNSFAFGGNNFSLILAKADD